MYRRISLGLGWTIKGAFIALIFSVGPTAAQGAIYSWQGSTGDWLVASNWGGILPTYLDVASIANGGTATIATGNASAGYLWVGENAGRGNIVMSGGVLGATYPVFEEYVGDSGTGTFFQSGGLNYGTLTLGSKSGAVGTYVLTGNACLDGYVTIGGSGTGTFSQSGGTTAATEYWIGGGTGSSGVYNLYSGSVFTMYQYVGYGGTGVFDQSGGSVTFGGGSGGGDHSLYIGYHAGSHGSYLLSGSGYLNMYFQHIGYSPPNPSDGSYSPSAIGLFQQSGGTNIAGYVGIGPGSTYQLAGGTLQISNGGLYSQGVFDGSGSGTLIASNCIVDLTNGQNLGSLSVNMGAHSLLIVPAGFDASTGFAHFSSLGVVGTAGGTITIPAGKSVQGWASINSLVSCQGSLSLGTVFSAQPGFLNLNNGVVVSGAGSVALSGSLSINDSVSGISGGYLGGVTQEYIGNNGNGLFMHTGGINSNASLFLGYGSSDNGAYNLSGSGILSNANVEDLGHSGIGGGSSIEYIGYSGSGVFNHSGGTNGAARIVIAVNPGSCGTYNLDGGMLFIGTLTSGSGAAVFNFNGGTLQSVQTSNISMPMTLGGTGTFNTQSYSTSLGRPLSGPGGLTKVGLGILSLATNNTFSGNTLIGSGTLALGGAFALQQSTLDTSGSGSLSFGSLTAAALGGLTGPGALKLANSASSPVALGVGNNNVSTTYGGTLSGSGSLTKIGSGSLTLTGTNTYAGGTMVAAGTLIVANPTAIYDGTSLTIGSTAAFTGHQTVLATQDSDTMFTVVPEPSAATLLLATAAAASCWVLCKKEIRHVEQGLFKWCYKGTSQAPCDATGRSAQTRREIRGRGHH